MARQVIRRNKRDIFGDTLGAVGQGLSGFAGGYMGRQQLDLAKQNAQNTQSIMDRAFGSLGGINAMPGAQAEIGIAQNQPQRADMGVQPEMSDQMRAQGWSYPSASGVGMPTSDLVALLLAQGALQRSGR